MSRPIGLADYDMPGAAAQGSAIERTRETCRRLNAREGWERFRVGLCAPRPGTEVTVEDWTGRLILGVVAGTKYRPRAGRLSVTLAWQSRSGHTTSRTYDSINPLLSWGNSPSMLTGSVVTILEP